MQYETIAAVEIPLIARDEVAKLSDISLGPVDIPPKLSSFPANVDTDKCFSCKHTR